MTVLITGANGFLGAHLCLYFAAKNFNVIAVSRGERRIPFNENIQYFSVDLIDEIKIHQLIESANADVVIHAAAMSKPDECEKNKEECLKQNVDATKFLVQSLQLNTQLFQSQFIYISTDFIFGENGPHGEDDEPASLNFYGESKLLAEHFVKQSALNFSIVRPVFIYGKIWQNLRPTFLHWVKNNLEQNKSIKVVSDQLRTPTFVLDICKGIEQIIKQKKQGIFHLAGKDIISPFEMAVKTAKILNLDSSLIENVTSENFYESVKRAKIGGLKIDKAIRELNYQPVSFEEGVQKTFDV